LLVRGEDDHQVGPGDDEREREREREGRERGKRRRRRRRSSSRQEREGPTLKVRQASGGEGGMDAHGDRLRTASCLGLGRCGRLVWFGWVV
jgi:hypothetical protein